MTKVRLVSPGSESAISKGCSERSLLHHLLSLSSTTQEEGHGSASCDLKRFAKGIEIVSKRSVRDDFLLLLLLQQQQQSRWKKKKNRRRRQPLPQPIQRPC